MPSRSMKTTPAVTCLKLMLSIFTIILWFIGAGLLAGGIYSKVKLGGYDLLSTTNFSAAPYVLIGIGVFIMLIGFFGCYSIGKGNTCMLRTFGFTVGVIFVAELALAISVIVFRSKITVSFTDGMNDAIVNYHIETYKDAVDNAQSTLECCGSTNYTDYWTLPEITDPKPNQVPGSCCKNDSLCKKQDEWVNLPSNANETAQWIYTQGCPAKFFGIVNSNLAVILGSLFGAAGFQLIGVILACCLASTINANKYELV